MKICHKLDGNQANDTEEMHVSLSTYGYIWMAVYKGTALSVLIHTIAERMLIMQQLEYFNKNGIDKIRMIVKSLDTYLFKGFYFLLFSILYNNSEDIKTMK
jgi:hypothetical protein